VSVPDLDHPLEDDREAYLARLGEGDRAGAARLCLALVESGTPAEEIITGVLAPAQAEVGRGWQDARWSIAMEHRASVITESVLEEILTHERLRPDAPEDGSAGRVVVLCAEGEWHTLPARMAAAVLRLRGADVTFVGPSLPAHEIAGFLGENPPAVVAVACALPLNLTGAWHTIGAVRQVGAYVVAGGRGFGPHGRWAQAVGADAFGADFSSGADEILARIEGPPPLPRTHVGDPAAIDEAARLRRRRTPLAEAATERALGPDALDRLPDRVVAATREDLAATLSALESAVLIDDRALVREFVGWFEAVMAARSLPLSFVAQAFVSLLDVLPDSLHRTRAAARAGLESCTQPL
jgi:methanogenic corrinoid protein MtbC1